MRETLTLTKWNYPQISQISQISQIRLVMYQIQIHYNSLAGWMPCTLLCLGNLCLSEICGSNAFSRIKYDKNDRLGLKTKYVFKFPPFQEQNL